MVKLVSRAHWASHSELTHLGELAHLGDLKSRSACYPASAYQLGHSINHSITGTPVIRCARTADTLTLLTAALLPLPSAKHTTTNCTL
jgi:hypothetical protein